MAVETKNWIDALVDRCAEAEETIEIVLDEGVSVQAKIIRDAAELSKVFKRAHKLMALTPDKAPPAWREYFPISESVAQGVAFAEAMLVPKPKQLDMLRLAKKAGPYFLKISTTLRARALMADVEEAAEEIEEEGND